jgi:hypothetical protein
MDRDDTISMFKTVAWERAKGSLREVAAASGQSVYGSRHDNYETIDNRVEEFIKSFEGDGLHE